MICFRIAPHDKTSHSSRHKDADRLVSDKIELARQYGRYGRRRIAPRLHQLGWHVNDKRIELL